MFVLEADLYFHSELSFLMDVIKTNVNFFFYLYMYRICRLFLGDFWCRL